MARFEFKLEPVLKHRRVVEEARRRALAEASRVMLDGQHELAVTQENLSRDKKNLAESLTGKVDVDRIAQHAAHALRAERRARQVAVMIEGSRQQMERAQFALVEASRQRRAIEILRERKFRSWQFDMERQERLALDELATIAYARRSQEEDES